MNCHILTRSNDKYFIGISTTHRHGKSATDNIAKNIVNYNIRTVFLVSSLFSNVSNAAIIPLPAQPSPGDGPPASTQQTPSKPSLTISSNVKLSFFVRTSQEPFLLSHHDAVTPLNLPLDHSQSASLEVPRWQILLLY